MEIGIIEISAGLGFLTFFLYYRSMGCFNYWEKLQVKGPKPIRVFGNFKDNILGRCHFVQIVTKFYYDFKTEPYVGTYFKNSPMLILRDLDLIQDVLVKDFMHFPNRGVRPDYCQDPLQVTLVNVDYEQWRPLRTNLTPAFTAAKLKDMFYLMSECAQSFESYVAKVVEKSALIECRELAAKYTTDTIGVCAFGLNMNAIEDDDSDFRKCGRQILDVNFINTVRLVFRELFPWVYEQLRPLVYNRANDFFVSSMKETMKFRRKNNFRRNDFVDLLMDLQNKPHEKLNNMELTDEILTAQALIFFLAGFESTSSTISNALYELALDPLCQDRLRKEIRDLLATEKKLTYDNIKGMKYLDKIVKETLRKYPPFSVVRKLPGSQYTFTSTKLTISKNTKILIPVYTIHRDPNIWPDPEVFDPERFNDENEKKRHPMSYLPFGNGPRICIAIRFADLQMKIGLITLINKFKVDTCDKTSIPYRINPQSIILKPLNGVHLKLTKI